MLTKRPVPRQIVMPDPSHQDHAASAVCATASSPLLTPDEAATLLGVTRKALERWRGAGVPLRYVRLNSKTIRYQRADVEGFVADSLRASTAVS